MKIAVVNKHPDDTLGGSEIQCDLLAGALIDRGHDVCYVAVGGRREDYERRYEVRTVARSPQSIYDAITELQPDIVYWRSCRYQFPQFMRLRRRTSIPIVFAVSNRYDIKILDALRVYKNKKRAVVELFRLWLQRRAMRRVDGVTTLNPDFLDAIPNRRKTVILNAMIPQSCGESFAWRRRYCVWVANLKEWKRPEAFVSLCRMLEDLDVDFLMVGKVGHQYSWLREKGAIPANLHILGARPLNEVDDIIASSLLLIHTGHAEGFGNVFIQAWIKGKATVSLDFDPGGFIGKEGLGVNAAGSFDRLAESVRRYVGDDRHRKGAEDRARHFAEKRFTPERLAEDLEGFFDTVITDRQAKSAMRGDHS